MTTDPSLGSATPMILIVDDVSIVAEAVARMLRQGRFAVRTVSSAAAALDALEEDGAHYDLLLSDVQLGGMNGFDLARQVRTLYPDLPIVFMSAYVDDTDDAPPFGAPLVAKPFTRNEIILTVSRAIETS
ncbi:MAG: response regulator [Myxococcota bacterium]